MTSVCVIFRSVEPRLASSATVAMYTDYPNFDESVKKKRKKSSHTLIHNLLHFFDSVKTKGALFLDFLC